jgi:hypothetical protein
MKKNKILLFVVTILLTQCTPSNKSEINIKSTERLSLDVDSIAVNEIINIDNWIAMDDCILIQTTLADTFFYAYSFPNFQFQSKFGIKGQGPNEYIYPRIATNAKTTMYLYDNAKNFLDEYTLSEGKFIIKNKIKVKEPLLVNVMLNIDEKTFCIKESSPNIIKLHIFKNAENELQHLSEYIVESDLNGETEYYDFMIANNKQNIVTFCLHKNEIHFYQVNDKNELMTIRYLVGEKIENKNTFCYTDLCCTEKYIYALYQGFSPESFKPSDKSVVEIYNWDGKHIASLNLDRIINRIIVNENINYIYAVSPAESDYIYRYKIDL